MFTLRFLWQPKWGGGGGGGGGGGYSRASRRAKRPRCGRVGWKTLPHMPVCGIYSAYVYNPRVHGRYGLEGPLGR